MSWTVKVEGGPIGPFYQTVAVNNRIYAFGGFNSPIEVQILQTENYQWSVLETPNPASPQYNDIPSKSIGHTVVAYNKMVYLWGGSDNCNALFCFNTKTHQWSRPAVSGAIPAPRRSHSACVINGAMFIFGGQSQTLELSQDVYKLHLNTLEWSFVQTTGVPPSHRCGHSATVIKNGMYIFGGVGNFGPNVTDVIYLDTNTMNWIRPELKGMYRPLERVGHLSFCYEDALFVFGGWNGDPKDTDLFEDLLRYDPGSCSWSIVKPDGNGPLPRFGQKCCVIGDRVFMIGGMRTFIQKMYEDDDDSDMEDDDFNMKDDDSDMEDDDSYVEGGAEEYHLDFEDVHILEFDVPSLWTLSLMKVVEHKLHKEDRNKDLLPKTTHAYIERMSLSKFHH